MQFLISIILEVMCNGLVALYNFEIDDAEIWFVC